MKPTVEIGLPGKVYAKNWAEIARCMRGISRSELARYMGVQVPQVKDIEEGNAVPSEAFVERMAEFLDFPLAYFYKVPDADDGWKEQPTSLDY